MKGVDHAEEDIESYIKEISSPFLSDPWVSISTLYAVTLRGNFPEEKFNAITKDKINYFVKTYIRDNIKNRTGLTEELLEKEGRAEFERVLAIYKRETKELLEA